MTCSEIAFLFSDVETIFILGFFFRPSPRRNICNEFKMSDRKLINCQQTVWLPVYKIDISYI